MGKKKFTVATLDLESKTFIIYVVSLSSNTLLSFSPLELDIHPSCRPQVFGLIAKEAPTKIPAKYLDFADVFFPDLASKLSKYIKINNYAIKLINS